MMSVLEKACSKCGTVYPATHEHFGKAKPCNDGTPRLHSWCRACTRASNNAWKQRQGEAFNERQRQRYRARHPEPTKTCNSCLQVLPQKREFFAYGKPYCRACGQRHLAEKHERARQKRRALLAQPTRTCSTCSKTYPNTEEHFNMRQSGSMCKPCRLAAGREWSRSNLEHIRVKQHRRRAKKLQAGGTHTPADVRRQLQSQKGLCYWCRVKLDTSGENKYHIDHLIALAKGGTNGPENIVCACPDCNLHKSDKMPWDFAGRLL